MTAPTSHRTAVRGAQPDPAGVGFCLFAAIAWGTTGTAATFAPGVPAVAIGAAAMGIGGLLQALLALSGMRAHRSGLWRNRANMLAGGIAVAIYPLAFYASMRLAGVTIGTVISLGSAPLISALIENRLEGSRLTPRWSVGAAIGLAGMALLSLGEGGHAAGNGVAGRDVALGGLLGLVAGGTYALYSWTARRMMHDGLSSRVAMGATFGVGGILLMPVLIATGAPFLDAPGNLAVGLYMALVPMFFGYIAFGQGLSRVSASLATTITLFEPVVAAVLAVVIVGERLPARGWLGVALIVVCLIWTTAPLPRRRRLAV
ncbi:DME family drug/metabolite transporter [Breoghania corrubedonensis]|uniref:DME family drug/metabolite transporter n=1 Tax=Breoghania corrubedonensis TaxID=665038 RepID=A0A2T5VCR5_9HYPH|nr:EamA family transporter [Breoghania corrubedonensis]PTW61549.1 DME family drug/metabolite transporter [Breoghania corrubedonensis]